MSKDIRIKKGLDIKLIGTAEKNTTNSSLSSVYAVQPEDFHGITPKLVAKDGAEVKAGDTLFYDKSDERILFSSPVSGKVSEVIRGERRRVMAVKITADAKQIHKDFGVQDVDKMSAEEVKNHLFASGCWPFIKQRPYDVVANPDQAPKAIFISAHATAPLAADLEYTLADKVQELQTAITAVAKLTEGKVHFSIGANSIFENLSGVELHRVYGPHPSGNVGTQIAQLDPINKGEFVWVITPQDLVVIGELLLTGKLNLERTVALTGSQFKNPKYIKAIAGASISDLITDNLKSEEPYNIKFAAIAAGITSHKIFIDDLLKLLKTKQHRKKGIKALKSYGPRIINVLLDLEYKDELEPDIKKNIPKIVAAFKNRNALKILKITLKSKNTTTRLETSKAFRRLKRNDENLLISAKIIKRSIYKECIYHKSILEIMNSIEHHMNLELMDDKEHNKQLIEARKKIYSALEIEVKKSYTTLFNLLSLLYNENDVKIIQKAINSGVREAKINAMELLENLLERNLRAVILPLLEYQVAEKNTVNTLFLNLTTLKEVDYLKKIMNISGSGIKHLVISYVNISNSREFIPVLLPLKKYRNRIVGQFAYDTYVKLLKNMN